MKVHLFKNEHVYNLALLDFLAGNFDLSDHVFVFQCKRSGTSLPVEPEKVHYLPGYMNLWRIKKLISSSQKVYFHLLPMGPVIFFWLLYRKLFTRALWIFWGADVYVYRKRYSSLKHFLYHLARKKIIRLIPDIAGYLEGDYELLKSVYRLNAQYYHLGYPIPTNFDLCNRLLGANQQTGLGRFTVLVGNSGSSSNRHLEAFSIISGFRNDGIEVICPLSYGHKTRSYLKKVMKAGHNLFGKRFIPVEDFLKPEEYLELINSADVALMNHDRQQGLGNILTLLYLGKKVFLRPDTNSYRYFTSRGIKVFDISKADRMSVSEFLFIAPEDQAENRRILREEFSVENYIRNWTTILEIQ